MKDTSSQKSSRRRRSPYKTGGSKPRADRTDSDAETSSQGEKKQPTATTTEPPLKVKLEKQPEPANTAAPATTPKAVGSQPATDSSKVVAPRDQPAAVKTAEKSAEKTKDKAPLAGADSSADSPSATAKTSPPNKDPDTARKSAARTPDKVAAANTATGPVAEPQQGTKGLYTLKPQVVEKSTPADQ